MAVAERRKAKFNGQELTILTDQLLAHKDELFGPHTLRVPARQRKIIWEDIRARVNAVASEFRDTEDLLRRWQDMKGKLRKDMAQHRAHMLATGGGSPREPTLEPYMRTALLILDPTTVHGFGSAEAGADSSDEDQPTGSQKGKAPPAPPRRKSGAGTSAAATAPKRPASPTPPAVRAKVAKASRAATQPAAAVPAAAVPPPPPVPVQRVAHKEMPPPSTSSSSSSTTASDSQSESESTGSEYTTIPSHGGEAASSLLTTPSGLDSEDSATSAPVPAPPPTAPVPAPPAPAPGPAPLAAAPGDVQQVLHDLLVAMGRMEAAKDNPSRHERDMLRRMRGLTAAVAEVGTGQVLSELQHLSEVQISALAVAERVATAEAADMAARREHEIALRKEEADRRREEAGRWEAYDAHRREEAAERHNDSVATQELLRSLIGAVSGLTAAMLVVAQAAPPTSTHPPPAATHPPAGHGHEPAVALPPALG